MKKYEWLLLIIFAICVGVVVDALIGHATAQDLECRQKGGIMTSRDGCIAAKRINLE